jgi:DDE superfamily endonuclease
LHTSDYYNRKKFHSIVLQGVVDDAGIFLDLYVGWPGSVGDARVWRNSPLFHRAIFESNNVPNLADREMFHNGNFLLGDKAYPLSDFLLPPYKRYNGQPIEEKLYNFLHSSTRMVVENAFGRLKGRFRRIKTCVWFRTVEQDCQAILAACIIHNICELNNDILIRARTDAACFDNNGTYNRACYGNPTTAKSKRDRLKDFLATFD